MAFTISGPVITQTGTNLNLSGLDAFNGVSLEGNTYILDGVRLEIAGSLIMNGFLEKIQFRNSPTNADTNNSNAQIAILSGGSFEVQASRSINGAQNNRPLPVIDFGSLDIDFGVVAFHDTNDKRHIACDVGGTVKLSGVFTGTTISNGLAYAFDGITDLVDVFLINQSNQQGSNQQVAFGAGAVVTIDNANIIGYAYTDRGGSYESVQGLSVSEETEGFVWNFNDAVNAQYLEIVDFNPQQISSSEWRTNMSNAASNGSVVNLINNARGNDLLYFTNQSADRSMRAIITNRLNITPVDGNFESIETVIYARDNNNGSRTGDFTPSGQQPILAGSDLVYTDFSSDVTFDVISGIFNPNKSLDARGINNSADLVFRGISYNHTIATYQPDLTGLGDKSISPIHLIDALISELNEDIVKAYTTIDDSFQFYDSFKSFLVSSYLGEAETIVDRVENIINARDLDVEINPNASQVREIVGNKLIIKSSSFDGNITTTGLVTEINGAVINGIVNDMNGFRANVSINITNIVPDSRILVVNNTDPLNRVMMFDQDVSGTVFNETVLINSDIELEIHVRKSTIEPFYRAFETTGTLTANGFNISITQERD